VTSEPLEHLAEAILSRGVRRVHVLGWRDLDDPDAGGSEVHADAFMTRWAAAGFEIVHRTSAARGQPATSERNGYRVVRRGGRYSVFPRAAVRETLPQTERADAIVEIWNGVPWFSPIWCRRPRLIFVHHVHGPMWDQIFPGRIADAGRFLETGIAPPIYRRSRVVTPSASTREALLELGFHDHLVSVAENGVDEWFTPVEPKAARPTVVAAARLAPVKRLELLLAAAEEARTRVADLELRIIGDGPERSHLERWIDEHDAGHWATLVGYVDREALRLEYSRAWVVASASLVEGWGLSLTEAAACGTPAVATDVPGHRSSVLDGVTGVLAAPDDLASALIRVLTDAELRASLAHAARDRAARLTWDASAYGVLEGLADVVIGRGHSTPTAPHQVTE